MQRLDIHIGRRLEDKGLFSSSTTTCCFKDPFLPMQKHLIVFQHLVVANVLQPAGPQAHQDSGKSSLELKGEPSKQSTFSPADRYGVNHRQDARETLRREVMPHQLGSSKVRVL
jgi:hypothetical protein